MVSASCLEFGVVTLNVGVASESRATRILEWLLKREWGVAILTETIGRPGCTALAEGLRSSGAAVFWEPSGSGDRGVMVAARFPFELSEADVPSELTGRVVVIESDPLGLCVVGVYVPCGGTPERYERKRVFLERLYAFLADRASHDGRVVLAGDLNVVATPSRGVRAYKPWELGAPLEFQRCGFTDALNGRDETSTWFGKNGDGCRYDYIYVSQRLQPTVTSVGVVHDTRHEQLSDHSAVCAGLSLGASHSAAGAK